MINITIPNKDMKFKLNIKGERSFANPTAVTNSPPNVNTTLHDLCFRF